ncbi:MAG: tRNA (adenosine(37)-N6)-threonylcarbamoyltransferase complex dimerization subunit type 1 TsaB [Phycisphaerales bacterium]|nr:MAG: tRNA (adenosine(37)-N6)-threonylcarbamoyltransferase complex dimerization subunit type 1 TsaB [Phycisphaerales bacterium]
MASEPLILAVETSSRIGSVAMAKGARLLGQSTFSASLRHSAEIFPAIASLLDRFGQTPADIAQIHISIGPGSFTGLRIAVAAAKSMHLAGSAQIVTVDSLDTIAANLTDAATDSSIQDNRQDRLRPDRVATILDAKRGQFFVAVYERTSPDEQLRPQTEDPGYRIPAAPGGLWRKVLPDCLMNAGEFLDRFASESNPVAVLGDGLLHHRDSFKANGVRILDEACWSPHAVQVHRLGYQKAQAGRFADPLTLTPFYLRRPQVTLRKNATPTANSP